MRTILFCIVICYYQFHSCEAEEDVRRRKRSNLLDLSELDSLEPQGRDYNTKFCEDGDKFFGFKCYHLSNQRKKGWLQSQNWCKAKFPGGTLVSPKTKRLYDQLKSFVESKVPLNERWTIYTSGVYNPKRGGTVVKWGDQSTSNLKKDDGWDWHPGFPTNRNGHNRIYMLVYRKGSDKTNQGIVNHANMWMNAQLLCQYNPKLVYVGCYGDGPNRDLPKQSYVKFAQWSMGWRQNQMRPEYCVEICRGEGRPYAGLQAHTQCFCSAWNWKPEKAKYGRKRRSQCNKHCPGDWSRDCGGDYRNSIYKVPGIYGPLTPESYKMENVMYEQVPKVKMVAGKPVAVIDVPDVVSVYHGVNNNDDPMVKSKTITSTTTKSVSVSHTADVTVGASIAFEGAVGLITRFKTEISATLEYGFSHTSGQTRDEERVDSFSFELEVPPRHQCTVKVVGVKKESKFLYSGTLVTKFKEDVPDKREHVRGELEGTETSGLHVRYERCIEICPPAVSELIADCSRVKKCEVQENCGEREECVCSRNCGMTCKLKKPTHPCFRDVPVCKNGGQCNVIPPEAGQSSRYDDTKEGKCGPGGRFAGRSEAECSNTEYAPALDDPEFNCTCTGLWQGKTCSWTYDLFSGGSGKAKCKHGWEVDAGVLGTEWFEKDVECEADEMCIRLEGELITRGPIRHYHNIYRCFKKDNCQAMVDSNCVPIALETTNSGHNYMIQAMTCQGKCCSTDYCNASPLDGSVVPEPAATTKATTASTTKQQTTTTQDPSTTPGVGPPPRTTTTTQAPSSTTSGVTPPPTTTETPAPAPTTTKATPKPRLAVEMKVVQEWDDNLNDPSSQAHKDLVNEMNGVMKEAGGFSDDTLPAIGWTFTKGSVIAKASIPVPEDQTADELLDKVNTYDYSANPRISSFSAAKDDSPSTTSKSTVGTTTKPKPSGGNSIYHAPSTNSSATYFSGILICVICYHLILV